MPHMVIPAVSINFTLIPNFIIHLGLKQKNNYGGGGPEEIRRHVVENLNNFSRYRL